MIDLRAIAGFLGHRRSNGGYACSCPVRTHGQGRGDRNPSLSLDVSDRGRLLIKCHCGCDARDVLAELRQRRLLEDRPRKAARSNTPLTTHESVFDPEAERRKVLRIWRRRRPIEGSIAETYLREARGYRGPIPPTLGFLPSTGDYEPALIAAFGIATEPDEPGQLTVAECNVRAVQITRLKPDGSGKANVEKHEQKITIGRGALGSPIMISAPNDLLGCCVVEGVEDALSIYASTGWGCWASGGASRLPGLADTVPSYIEFVTVVADRDKGGIEYAEKLATALRARRISNKVVFPDEETSNEEC